MHVDQFMRQMQPHAYTVTREITLHKPLEQFATFFLGNTHTRIRYTHFQSSGRFVYIHHKLNLSF